MCQKSGPKGSLFLHSLIGVLLKSFNEYSELRAAQFDFSEQLTIRGVCVYLRKAALNVRQRTHESLLMLMQTHQVQRQ